LGAIDQLLAAGTNANVAHGCAELDFDAGEIVAGGQRQIVE